MSSRSSMEVVLRRLRPRSSAGCRTVKGRRSFTAMADSIDSLIVHERVRAARHHIERADEVTLARQAALSAIPAPTGAEGARAARVAELFREAGLWEVGVDDVGNVTGWAGARG